MTHTILKLVSTALSIWESKERTKYIDKLIELEDQYKEALTSDFIDHGEIDYLEDQIERFANIVATDIRAGK